MFPKILVVHRRVTFCHLSLCWSPIGVSQQATPKTQMFLAIHSAF